MEIVKYLASAIPWPYPESGADEFLDLILPEMKASSRFVWAITITGEADNELIGLIELSPEGPFHRGFWLMPEHHRKGFMTEAVAAVNDFAFKVIGMESMRLGNALPNIGSRRLKEKSGAVLIEVDPDVEFVGGIYPEEIWNLSADEWFENRASFMSGSQK
jgi:RimJ/RimL family protein N-acetyltransferase